MTVNKFISAFLMALIDVAAPELTALVSHAQINPEMPPADVLAKYRAKLKANVAGGVAEADDFLKETEGKV
jgi:hypothetical protein